MKRIGKVLLTFLLVAVVALGLAGCNKKTSGQGDKKIKIGLIMYMWNDNQGKEIQNYCNYLAQNLPLEFAYESTYYNDDAHLTCVENLISAGCNAIIAGYDTSLVSAVDTCTQAGVYYAVSLDYVSQSDFGTTTPSKYFVGGTTQFGGNTAGLGEQYAAIANKQGISNVCGVSFPAWAFVDGPAVYGGFSSKLKELNASASVAELNCAQGFDQTTIQAATNETLNANAEAQAIFGLASGLDYVYPVIQDKTIKLISLGYNDSVKSLFESNKLVAAGTNNQTQAIASCVARIVNACYGDAYADQATGAYNVEGIVNGVAGYPVMSSAAEVDEYTTYVFTENMANGSVTVEELKNVIIHYNPNAKLADLNNLTNRTLAEIKAARA